VVNSFIHLHPSLKGKVGAYQSVALFGRLLALPTNSRLGWKSKEVTNTLAYYDTAVKCLKEQAPDGIWAQCYKNIYVRYLRMLVIS
jgi:hypothetical protein